VGAQRSQLMRQFCGEAILMSFMALSLGMVLAELSLPTFNQLANKELVLDFAARLSTLMVIVGVTLLAGISAGSYPALVLSGFHPVEVLKGQLKVVGSHAFTCTLVVVQFSLSVFLIISMLLMSSQLDFLKTKNLGLRAEQVVVIPTHTEEGARLLEVYRSKLAGYHQIVHVTGATEALGREKTFSTGYTVTEEGTEFFPFLFRIDYEYLETLGIELVEGRNFSRNFSTDVSESVIVNETLVSRLGWESPIGKTLMINGVKVQVVGVVKDFHFLSLHRRVQPAVLHLNPGWPIRHILVRISPENLPATLKLLRNTWRQVAPNLPFEYYFLDEDFERQYRAEERWSNIVGYSSIFAIFIACMGLFGLTALSVTRRTKEIGIRKVLGASVSGITALLSKDFVKLVLLANLLAWPVAWYAMNRWLQNFAYRIEISWWVFALAGGVALVIALLTVSTQAVRAALANPAEALRYE
ncbi:MAG: ABC transporter permease, partial [bacterium]